MLTGAVRPGVKQTRFPKGEPDSLYHRDSPWISSYHIQNPFQSNITDITHVTTSHGFIYYIIRRIVIRISEYKPLGLKENKQKAEMISNFLGNFIFRIISTGSSECRSGHPSHRLPLSSCQLLYSDPASIRLSPRTG